MSAPSLPDQLRAIAARAIPNGTTAETRSPVHTIHCLDVHMQALEAAARAIERLTLYAAGVESERDALIERVEALELAARSEGDLAQRRITHLPADDTEGGDPS